MRLFLTAGFIAISLGGFIPHHLWGAPPHVPDWQEVRAHQPPALHLKMKLAKDHFFQGERIDATLLFYNDDANNPYSVTVGVETPGVFFRAIDEKGNAVVNPNQWHTIWYPVLIQGMVGNEPFGQYSLTLPVNDSVRFDHPGIYKLYAQSGVAEGTSHTNRQVIELVSDKATVTELVRLLRNPKFSGCVEDGLLRAPNPALEADNIMSEVKADKLVLDEVGVELYGQLKIYPMISNCSPQDFSEQDLQARFTEFEKAREVAQEEVVATALTATENQGPSHVEALWTAFKKMAQHHLPSDKKWDGGKARQAVTDHQLELSADHVNYLLDNWQYWSGPDFLPLVRREAAPPANNLNAVIALAGLKPDEARPMITHALSDPDLHANRSQRASLEALAQH